MKSKHLAVVLLVLLCSLFSARRAVGQAATGYTSLDYDDSSGVVTAYSETDLDYDIEWDYDAYVGLSVSDDSGALVASGSARDYDEIGFISITLEFSGTSDVTYTAVGTHKAYANYSDYDYEDFYPYRMYYYYWDTWYFGFFEGQGIYEPWYYYFLSPGYSPVTRRLRYIPLGSTTDYAMLTVRAPHPVNFHMTGHESYSNGQLHFDYAWDSSTGTLDDLSQCTIGEIVYLPGRGSTYTWPKPPFDQTEPTVGRASHARDFNRRPPPAGGLRGPVPRRAVHRHAVLPLQVR